MGQRGPVPKRSELRRRRNKPDEPITSAPASDGFEVPEPPEEWHYIAKRFYLAALESGESYFWEPSDVMQLFLTCESISRDLKDQFVGINERTGEELWRKVPLKGANLAAYLKSFTSLGISEGDRRRMGIELTRESMADPDEEAADDIVIRAAERFGSAS